MKTSLLPVVALVAGLGFASVARADDMPPSAPAAEMPWTKDQSLLAETEQTVQSQGVLAIEPHVAALERALVDAQLIATVGDTTYVLTDGMAEGLIAMAMTAESGEKNSGTKRVAVANPYPVIALYLGSYYDEVGRSEDALRVLDMGLANSFMPELGLGEHRPLLISERGAALIALKRWPDALKDYEDGLKNDALSDSDRARMERGMGFVLTELDRLDEAEQAYRDSLKLEPGNVRAQNELQYIARLKAGGPRAPSGLTSVQPHSGADGTTPQ